ncbi:MAG: hypothetical protein V4675_07625 [Verrucomicrobiota bacterium]
MNPVILRKELLVSGSFFRTARLRHEWCDFLENVPEFIQALAQRPLHADLFTFVDELHVEVARHSYHAEPISIAILPVESYAKWWDGMGFKARNKVRKAQKSGAEVRVIELNEMLARGVEKIYNECPIRQGRKFYHYGKRSPEILTELSSFPDESIFVGVYLHEELIGFMKLFKGQAVLRTVHIIATIQHRDLNVMDLLIAKAVELCDLHQVRSLQYGSWTDGGIGAFRSKHGFKPVTLSRYFVPLNWRGAFMLKTMLHHPLRERLPTSLVEQYKVVRHKWNTLHLSKMKARVES